MSPANAQPASAAPRPADPHLADPREVLRRHRRPVAEPNPAAERIERLLAVQGEWLRCRVRSTALDFRLDADELCQELMLSMLRRSTTVDEGNQRSADLARQPGRLDRQGHAAPPRPGGDRGAEDLEAIEHDMAPAGRPPDPPGPMTLDDKHLVQLGLTPHEAQVVALRCTGVDMPLKDFAELVHRSYASVRKEYERGTRKIEELFGLTAEEVLVVRDVAQARHCRRRRAAPQPLQRRGHPDRRGCPQEDRPHVTRRRVVRDVR